MIPLQDVSQSLQECHERCQQLSEEATESLGVGFAVEGLGFEGFRYIP